jgi:hypothetical protein
VSGKLRDRLDIATKVNGLELCDLTVLAVQNEPYRLDTPTGHQLAAWFMGQIERAVPRGNIHLRAFHYLLIGNALRPDGLPSWAGSRPRLMHLSRCIPARSASSPSRR